MQFVCWTEAKIDSRGCIYTVKFVVVKYEFILEYVPVQKERESVCTTEWTERKTISRLRINK